MRRLSYFIYHLSFSVALLAAGLLSACSNDSDVTTDEQPLPEGMGRIRITICTPEANPDLTRAVGDPVWEDPDHDWEKLHSFRILIFDNTYKLVDIIERTNPTMSASSPDPSYQQSATVKSDALIAGTYYIYATANYADGFVEGNQYTLSEITDKTISITNGYSETNIPMSGKLNAAVDVINSGETDAGTITVWRAVGKIQFEFFNETTQKITIKGIEVDPINQASVTDGGIFLFSKDVLTSEVNLKAPTFTDVASNVTATWALHETMQTEGTVSAPSYFSQAQLSWGPKLESTGKINTNDNSKTLQKFKAIEKVSGHDEDAAIIFAVKPNAGYTFTPKKLSFSSCRGGTDGGYFDVVTVCNGTTTKVNTQAEHPSRYNGENGNQTAPFITDYEYNLSSATTAGVFYVMIYLYNLDQNKEYAFSDVVITGDVKSTDGSTGVGITLPAAALTDVGPVFYTPSTAFELNAGEGYDATTNPTKKLFFYVNETDASYTTKNNQFSLRFKIQRGDGSEEEIRYGMTTPYIDGLTGGNGFNVIRRNDWIHIPIHITDWQLRIEPLAFVPIAGYPATTVSSDGLNATFSTGGMIALQPFIKKYTDSTWRDFGDSEVTFASVTWKNSDGTDVSGDGKIVKTAFAYDYVTKCIIGELNQAKVGSNAKTTMTVNIDLGKSPDPVYHYSFSFNVILQ
ncbi:MAG: hypothetical protein K6G32_12165 [Prevotella sp.]|nr:hypothetical protein [Prevotella sp.]